MPGHVLRGGLRESWTCPNPGWVQTCDSVEVDTSGLVVRVAGADLDMEVGRQMMCTRARDTKN